MDSLSCWNSVFEPFEPSFASTDYLGQTDRQTTTTTTKTEELKACLNHRRDNDNAYVRDPFFSTIPQSCSLHSQGFCRRVGDQGAHVCGCALARKSKSVSSFQVSIGTISTLSVKQRIASTALVFFLKRIQGNIYSFQSVF